MTIKTTLIFDIGKTNKKYFLFDEELRVVDQSMIRFDEIQDDDGDPADDLMALTDWILSTVNRILNEGKYILENINFSTYGASLVHLNKQGEVVAPFYNYMKPLPEDFFDNFFKKYGGRNTFSLNTASPILGMLNAGFQLHYLKEYKPQIHKKITHSLHFPQYLSYLFTNEMVSEYTSIGCHTSMWNFKKMEYHSWIRDSGFINQLPRIVPTDYSFQVKLQGHSVNIGVGIHDTSSAMIPYLLGIKEPFCLLSTGTWSLSMNAFNSKPLKDEELKKDCLNFLSFRGESTRVSRLHLGKEIRYQAKKIGRHFNCDYERYKSVTYDAGFISKRKSQNQLLFNYQYLQPQMLEYKNSQKENLGIFDSFEDAYRNLLDELVELQLASIQLTTEFKLMDRMFIDGGFAENEPFLQRLANKLPAVKIFASSFAQGSAVGAAMLMNDLEELNLSNLFNFKQYMPTETNLAK